MSIFLVLLQCNEAKRKRKGKKEEESKLSSQLIGIQCQADDTSSEYKNKRSYRYFLIE